MNFRKQIKPKNTEEKQKREDFLKILYERFEVRERVLNAFYSKIFSIKTEDTGFSDKVSDHSNRKILSSKQMLKRLPIALTQVKTGTISENLPNQNICILFYRAKVKKYATT